MSKKAKAILIIVIGVLAGLALTAFLLLWGIRGEFTSYLKDKYHEQSFEVGFTKIDPIYGKYFASVTCLDDYTKFSISKSFKTKKIHESYLQDKSQNQYNSKINEAFYGSGIESSIKSVTGGGKQPFTKSAGYDQINIYLTGDVQHSAIAKKVLNILHERDISAGKIILTYEKDRHVYEIRLSSGDYSLTESDIETKVQRIK